MCPSIVNAPNDFIFAKRKSSGEITEPSLNVSLFSCLFHDYGKGILAHELAHLISYLSSPHNPKKKMSEDSYEQYEKLRKCATNRYKNLIPLQNNSRGIVHNNDYLRTEEDTADIISYSVLKDEPIHYSCALLNMDQTEYTDLKVLYGPESQEPHSSTFLRVLMEAIHKRTKLSPACQQVIDRYKDRIDFTPCHI